MTYLKVSLLGQKQLTWFSRSLAKVFNVNKTSTRASRTFKPCCICFRCTTTTTTTRRTTTWTPTSECGRSSGSTFFRSSFRSRTSSRWSGSSSAHLCSSWRRRWDSNPWRSSLLERSVPGHKALGLDCNTQVSLAQKSLLCPELAAYSFEFFNYLFYLLTCLLMSTFCAICSES